MRGEAVVYDTLTLYANKHPIQFTVGIGFYGEIVNGRVKGVDLNKERERLESLNMSIRGKEIRSIFEKYRGMETIAQHFLSLFKNADFVVVIENGTEKVKVWRT